MIPLRGASLRGGKKKMKQEFFNAASYKAVRNSRRFHGVEGILLFILCFLIQAYSHSITGKVNVRDSEGGVVKCTFN